MVNDITNVRIYRCLVFVLILSFKEAVGISCYSCESVSEEGCGKSFDFKPHFKWDCSRIDPPRYLENELTNHNATACMKKEYNEMGVRKIVRSCFFGDSNNTDMGCRLDPMIADVTDYRCYICDDDNYCNVGVTVNSTPFCAVILASSFIAIIQIAKFYISL